VSSLLILSFSPIASDARVLKQVVEFAGDYQVTTCGYGPAPEGVAEHIRIPDEVRHDDLSGRLITLHLYRRAYWALGAVRWARKALSGRSFDVILADDVEAVPLALRLRPARGVHADLHEYSPLLHEDIPQWRRRITPYVMRICRAYLPGVASATTVSRGLQREYEKEFGLRTELVTNAAPYRSWSPTPVHTPIRLVHSGACLRNRALHEMIEGAILATRDVAFDFYLTPNDPGYLDELKAAAAGSGGRVAVHDPVPYAELATTLHDHDLGVHVLAPTNFNNRWALPNKLFDYVQARLGVLIGPTPEMAEFVDRYGLGAVAAGFSARDFADVIDALDADAVAGYKAASDAAAHELSAQSQVRVWRTAIDRLARGADE
jgi:hypothetical protein